MKMVALIKLFMSSEGRIGILDNSVCTIRLALPQTTQLSIHFFVKISIMLHLPKVPKESLERKKAQYPGIRNLLSFCSLGVRSTTVPQPLSRRLRTGDLVIQMQCSIIFVTNPDHQVYI